MADHTFAVGEALTASNTNTYLAHTGGTWNTWTPAVTQSGSVTVTVNEATYYRSGRYIKFTALLSVTGSGTGANDIVLSLPVATKAGYTANYHILGSATINDNSASTRYPGQLTWVSTTTAKVAVSTSGSTSFTYYGATGMTAGLASADTIAYEGEYEAAS